ncbi:MAG TPA: beta-ketoacyl-ACP synthase II [Clostridiaceae bacterium]|jgi:3-oxoacyl-[acyl-carrier-protein] synthase II|nr:beta-ketoacyl-ACP synthase II [Clostridiaceae bacterium]
MRRVVVTGLGVVSPVGSKIDTFWSNLVNGKNGIDYITYFDTTNYKVKIAAEVKGFNASDYFERSEARKMDLFSQYAVAAADQAVRDSGLEADKVDGTRFGVYVGSGIGGIKTFYEETLKLVQNGPRRVSPFFVPMMISNMASGLIAIRYGAKGPCLPVVTACATGTHAIGEAYRNILHGYSDIIIAGGSEAAITELAIAGFINCMALSTTNDPNYSSIPFDLNRNGFVMGEGAGMLILEEYEHAVKRGAKIYAEVKGYANTCDAYHITAPDPETEMPALAIKSAAEQCGIGRNDLSKVYVNAHGTGTPLNDKCETMAFKKAFGEGAYELGISSTKSMTGHMLGAAGAVEAIVSVLALRDGVIPPTINLKAKDPDCDLDYTPNQSVRKGLKYALSTSLGFGGHNACIAFERMEDDEH